MTLTLMSSSCWMNRASHFLHWPNWHFTAAPPPRKTASQPWKGDRTKGQETKREREISSRFKYERFTTCNASLSLTNSFTVSDFAPFIKRSLCRLWSALNVATIWLPATAKTSQIWRFCHRFVLGDLSLEQLSSSSASGQRKVCCQTAACLQ